MDKMEFSHNVQRGFKLLFLTLFILFCLEICSWKSHLVWKTAGVLLNSDLRKYAQADDSWRKRDELPALILNPADPRLPKHVGKPYLPEGHEHDKEAALLSGEENPKPIFFTNGLGFRAPQPLMPKPSGEFRIFCIGGSTTEQGGPKQSYPVFVEKYLQKNGFPEVKAYVTGMFSYSSRDSLLRFKEYLSYAPDLIIVYHGINELLKIHLKPHPETTFLGSHFLSKTRDFLSDEEARWKRIRKDIQGETIRNFELMIRDAREKGVQIIFIGFVIPDFQSLKWKDKLYFESQIAYRFPICYSTDSYTRFIFLLNQEIQLLCGKYGIIYLDAPSFFKNKGLDFFYDPCHRRTGATEEWGKWVGNQLRGLRMLNEEKMQVPSKI
jgi:hypothetical protein